MSERGESEWDVRVDDGTVVVELPRKLVLEAASARRMHDALVEAVSRPEVDRVLTLVDVEHPLGAGLHEVVRQAARVAPDHGVTDWDIVAEHRIKGTALARAIPGLNTAVFEDERAARRRCT